VVRGSGQVTVNFTPPTNTGGLPITGFEVDVLTGTTVVRTVQGLPATGRSTVVTGLTNGTTYTFTVRALNLLGPSAPSAASAAVTPAAASAPAAPVIGNATAGRASATVRWTVPANGGSAILRHEIEVTRAGVVQAQLVSVNGANTNNTVINGLTPGQPYRFRVRAVNLIGAGAFSAVSNTVTPTAAAPGAPATAVAAQGAVGGARTARVDWTPPASNGGSAITGYRVKAERLVGGIVLETVNATVQPSTARFWQTGALTAGSWRFTVQAFNAVGNGPRATSNTVAAR
jgi:hypothetical protein